MINANKMTQWWQTELGQYVFAKEKAAIGAVADNINGYFQMQVYSHELLLPTPKMPCCQFLLGDNADITSCAEYLPLKSNSVDVVLLPHVLEFSSDPHQVLRETERVLGDGGTLILCCFKPMSLWGLRHLFSMKKKVPWQGRYFPRSRIKDWLALLNFEVMEVNNEIFVPPFASAKSLERWDFLNQWGKRYWPRFAAVSIIIAKKRVLPLTPTGLAWRKRKLFPSAGLIKPVTGYNKTP